MIIKISSNSRICQSPVLIIFFLLLPIIATSTGTPPAVKKSNFSSILIPFPFFGLTDCCIRKWLESDSFSNNSLFMKDMTLEVHEFSIREDTGYVVRYCKTPISSSLNSTLATIDGKNGRAQKKCKFGFFIDKNWEKTIKRDRKMIIEMGQVIVAMGWEKANFTFWLFAIDNPISSSTQFPIVKWKNNEENAHLALKKDEDRKATLCWNKLIFQSLLKYYRIWLYLMLGLGSWFLLVGKRWMCIKIKKRKDIKLKKEFFKRNGGILLQQQLSSFDSGIERCKIFNSNELNKATDHFNVNRILGEGGQGTVYKGMLEDGRVIAIKKSKVIDEEKLAEFINEVVILSQINHRNVVKLLGCCLETEVPMLVYEFIANGTLFQYIHDHNEELPFTWDMRLRIANEVAGALSYLHSTASSPIYHRDIKSANILLDNKYRAKVADFGASRSIAIDQTHLTTKVQGTLGYLDPEYFQSNQLTNKSDVYSFGVILVELLTGQKAIFSTTWQENVSLATLFVHYMKENRLYDILDAQIVMRQGKKDEIMAFANLAKRCLNPSGKERPTMKEVERELEEIRASKKRKPMFSRLIKKLK